MSASTNDRLMKLIQDRLLYKKRLNTLWYFSLELIGFATWILVFAFFEHGFISLDTGSALFVGLVFAFFMTAFLAVSLLALKRQRWRAFVNEMPVKERQSIVTDMIECAAALSVPDFLSDDVRLACDRYQLTEFRSQISRIKKNSESAAMDILSDDVDRMIGGFDFIMDTYSNGYGSNLKKLRNRADRLANYLDAQTLEGTPCQRLENLIAPETLASLRNRNEKVS